VDPDISYEQFYVVIHAVPLGDTRTTREIPVERSNEDLLNDIMSQTDENAESVVPYKGIDEGEVDPDFTEPTEEVDYRKSNQKSFLDDPTHEF
jgi:hypothetical protein